MRIGFGYDAHRLVAGRPLMIGGVAIPFDKGLAGHSDADVLLHAIADALLGAAALGDIGVHFPDTDPRWAGMAGADLLGRVADKLAEAGYRARNVDATVVLERPRLRPYASRMRAVIAERLSVEEGAVSVKATTHEGMGPMGREEGAAAYAVCVIVSTDIRTDQDGRSAA